jgi:predicted chitinase
LEARSSTSDSDTPDPSIVAEALDLARRQARDVLDRGLPAVGAVNLVPYRRRDGESEVGEPVGGEAAFLGQVAAETGSLQSLREGLYYSDPQRAANIFHRTFRGDSEAARPYLRDSEKMANHVYGALPGNRGERSGDGYAYRGGGFLQITGRDAYRDAGLEERPEQIGRANIGARASVDHWQSRGLNTPTFNPITSQRGFDAMTKRINSASLNAQARWEAYRRGLQVLSKPNGAGR